MGVNKLIIEYLKMRQTEIKDAAKLSGIPYTTLKSWQERPNGSPSHEALTKFKFAFPGFNENNEELVKKLEEYDSSQKVDSYSLRKDRTSEGIDFRDEIIQLQKQLLNIHSLFSLDIKINTTFL